MKMPINCPICGDPLVDFLSKITAVSIHKSCDKQLNHKLFIKFTTEDEAEYISLYPSHSFHRIIWYSKNLVAPYGERGRGILVDSGRKFAYIPYFEPDFSDYPKLLAKLKTYLLFS